MENEIQKSATENLQVIPAQDEVVKNELVQNYSSASSLKLTSDESEKIAADFDDDLIEIRPDGYIYLPQVYYRKRLNTVVGVGQWGLVVKATYQETKAGKAKFFLNGFLVIRGCYIGEAVGEAELHEDNGSQSNASVWESAKSDCITRCCKDLGIGSQVYEPKFIREWQKNNAVQVWIKGKGWPQWRKTSSPPLKDETGLVDPNAQTKNPNKAERWLNETLPSGGVTAEWMKAIKDLLEEKTTILELSREYKMSRKTEDRLRDVVAEKKAENKQSAAGQKISGEWYAKLEKCKCKEDVDALGTENATVINANPALRKLFVDTKAGLPAKEKLDLSTKHELQNQ